MQMPTARCLLLPMPTLISRALFSLALLGLARLCAAAPAAPPTFEQVQRLYSGLQRNGRRQAIQAARRARARRPLEAR